MVFMQLAYIVLNDILHMVRNGNFGTKWHGNEMTNVTPNKLFKGHIR